MRYLILAAGLALAGCANSETNYVDDAGHVGRCSMTAFGLIATIVASSEYQKCKDFYLGHGFHVPQ